MVLGNRSGGRITIAMLLGGGGFGTSVPADARSLARIHLKEVGGRIDRALADAKGPGDDATRAHLEECKERIAKALAASMQVKDCPEEVATDKEVRSQIAQTNTDQEEAV